VSGFNQENMFLSGMTSDRFQINAMPIYEDSEACIVHGFFAYSALLKGYRSLVRILLTVFIAVVIQKHISLYR
jgi:hypothetical protein